MEQTTALWIGGLALAMYLAWKYEQRKDETRNVQFDLRYPQLDSERPDGDTFSARTFVDFEQMVLVNEMSDYAFHHTRVLQLRRLDGPRWEIREEEASRERSRAHLTVKKESGWEWAEEELAALADFDWKPCGYSDEIEPKYQLYLRHRDVTAATFRGGMVERAVENDFVEGSQRPSRRVAR